MAHAQKQIFCLSAKRTSPFKSAGGVSSVDYWPVELCASAVVMLDTPCSAVVRRVLATHCIRQFPPSLPLPHVTVCHHISTGIYWIKLNSSVWNKKPTRCHLVLYLFLLYKLLNIFRATLCPSSGADDLVVFFHVWCSAVLGKYVAQQVVLRTSQWTQNQPTVSDCLHSHGTTPQVTKYH